MPPGQAAACSIKFTETGVHLLLKSQLQGLEWIRHSLATLDRQRNIEVDAVIAATGLRPETAPGTTRRAYSWIVAFASIVNPQTSNTDIYALGDCAEIKRSDIAVPSAAIST
ncbi:FAD-dependent oxidoreductase [Shigella flexneri]